MPQSTLKLDLSHVKLCDEYSNSVNFKTFVYEDAVYYATLQNAQKYVKNIAFQNLLDNLAQEEFIPHTKLSSLTIEGFGKIYQQHSEYFHVPMLYASPLLLKEAAINYIRMMKFLHKAGYCLTTGQCRNIVVQGLNKPKWCNIEAIIPSLGDNYYMDIIESLTFMLYPLLLRKKGFALGGFMRLGTKEGICINAAKTLGLIDFELNTTKRGETLDELEKIIENIEFPWGKSTWSNYHDARIHEDNVDTNLVPHEPNRDALITRLLKILKPKTVVDIAANAGVYSRLAARLGAEVLAIEPDETAVAQGHLYLRQFGALNTVKFMVAGVDCDLKQPADVALALALTHHLFLTNNHSWNYIVQNFAEHTNKHLITEFMPNGLSVYSKQPNLPANYTLELFVEQLQCYFSKVEVLEREVPEGAHNRILLLCTDKKEKTV